MAENNFSGLDASGLTYLWKKWAKPQLDQKADVGLLQTAVGTIEQQLTKKSSVFYGEDSASEQATEFVIASTNMEVSDIKNGTMLIIFSMKHNSDTIEYISINSDYDYGIKSPFYWKIGDTCAFVFNDFTQNWYQVSLVQDSSSSDGPKHFVGLCRTSDGTSNKVVGTFPSGSFTSEDLVNGTTIDICFINSESYTDRLNLKIDGVSADVYSACTWDKYETVSFIYFSNYWRQIGVTSNQVDNRIKSAIGSAIAASY